MLVCKCVYVCMYVCIYVRRDFMDGCKYVYVCMHTHIKSNGGLQQKCKFSLYTHTQWRQGIRKEWHTHIHKHAYTMTYTYAYKQTHIHKHIHIHIHAQSKTNGKEYTLYWRIYKYFITLRCVCIFKLIHACILAFEVQIQHIHIHIHIHIRPRLGCCVCSFLLLSGLCCLTFFLILILWVRKC